MEEIKDMQELMKEVHSITQENLRTAQRVEGIVTKVQHDLGALQRIAGNTDAMPRIANILEEFGERAFAAVQGKGQVNLISHLVVVGTLALIIIFGGLYIFELRFKGEGAGFKIEAQH